MTLEQLSAAATEGEYDKQVQLWFFRELTSDQRLALFKLCGLPVDEIGHNHGHQRLCLKRVLRRTGQLVAVSGDAIERVARALFIKELGEPDDWDKWQSLLQEYRNLATAAIAAMKDTQP